MIKLRSDLYSRTTPHASPLRASYGVSFVSYTKKNDRDISRAHLHTAVRDRHFKANNSYFNDDLLWKQQTNEQIPPNTNVHLYLIFSRYWNGAMIWNSPGREHDHPQRIQIQIQIQILYSIAFRPKAPTSVHSTKAHKQIQSIKIQ